MTNLHHNKKITRSKRHIALFSVICFLTGNLTLASLSQDTGWQKLMDAGNTAYKQNDYQTAQKYFSSAVDKSTAEGNKAQLASSLNDLALVLAAQGNTDEAQSTLNKALSIKVATFGADNIALVPTLNNLGKLNCQLSNWEEAEKYYSQALSISEKTNGPNHASIAVCLNNLASVLRQEHKLDEAKNLLERALSIVESNFGKNSDAYAIQLNNLGKIAEDQGNTEEATKLYAQALSLREKPNELNPNEVSDNLNKLAAVCRKEGKFEEAESLLSKSLRTLEQTKGTDNKNLIIALNNLAMVERELQKYNQAEALYMRSTNITEKAFGTDSKEYANSLDNLGDLYLEKAVYHKEGKFEETETLLSKSLNEQDLSQSRVNYQQSLDIRKKLFGDKSQELILSLNKLVEVSREQGNYTLAESEAKEIIAILENNPVKDRSTLATGLTNLALLYQEEGKNDQVEPLLKQTVEIAQLPDSGCSKEEIANDLNNLARFYREQGNYSQSQECYKQSLALRKSTLVPDDPRIAASLHNYANLLRRMNNNDEADKLDLEANNIERKN
jgi:tetratricopeptide (TPR) repeat protein